MNLEEIKKKYPDQWVLIEYEQLENDLKVRKGNVLAHSSSKEEIYKALSQSSGKNVSVEFTGIIPPDVAVMFVLFS